MEINDIFRLLEEEKEKYIKKKVKEYQKEGFSKDQVINKANQSWRTHIGARIEEAIFNVLATKLKNTELKFTTNKILSGKNLTPELEIVKRMLVINYGDYLFLPNANIIVYKICG
ncbi:MAG: hypothetical protein ACTSYD_06530 [Candidatus Heimdallarchaeaceae archaeon]